MSKRILFYVVVLLFVLAVPDISEAQKSTLQITLTRPGEGELLYSGPGAPYVSVPVSGWVTADHLEQVQIKLEVIQGARVVGSLTGKPNRDGKYTFDVAINDSSPDDHNITECAAGDCHFLSSLGFPAGRSLVRVTATDSTGNKATAEHSIIVDHSGSANVPVQVVIEGENTILKGINLAAQTRLYEWRSRQYIASTDANGRAMFNIEALGQSSTSYIFRLDPIVVDGVQYSSREYARLTLPPGASAAEPVKLFVQASRGQIAATVTAPNRTLQNPLTVYAIELPSGLVHSGKTINGQATLNSLRVGKQLLAVNAEEAASQGLASSSRTIDLTTNPITSTIMPLTSASSRVIRGVVHDSQGSVLPLVWLAPDEQDKSIRTFPATGGFVWANVPSDVHSAWVVAPGYWRRAVALDFDQLDIELTREPGTRTVPWGNGSITVPRESLVQITSNQIVLKRGWLWGKGTSTFTITTPDAEIELSNATFAIESLLDVPSWLYVIEGQAKVTILASASELAMTSGQMLAFGFGVTRPFPVALDNTAVRALHADESIPVRIATDSNQLVRVQDELARRGISIRMLALVLLGLLVAVVFVARRRMLSR
jgi:hypothetical protein